ncbi:MAG: tetratricopeptide repeat protein [Deferrisomatales bacterium]
MAYRSLCLLLCSVLAWPAWASDAQRRGVAAFRAGDPAAAVQAVREALAAEPGSPVVRFHLAQAYHELFLRSGLHYRETVDAYEAVIATLGEGPGAGGPRQLARVFAGQVLIRGGEHGRAAEQFRTFLAAWPDHYAREGVWNGLGVALYNLNDYEEAVKAFEEALRVDPSYGPARFNLRSLFTRLSIFDQAMANRRAGQPELALRDLARLLGLAPRYGAAHLQTALLLRELGRGAEAEAHAARALDLVRDPRVRFGLHDLRGDLLAARGETEPALAEYRRCLQIFPAYLQVAEKIDALERKNQGEGGAEPAPEPDPRPGPAVHAPVTQFPM